MGSRRVIFAFVVLMAFLLSGCDDKAPKLSNPGGSVGTGGSSAIAATVQEWSVAAATKSARAGSITFNVTNKGPKHKHEFVVVKTNVAPNALPTNVDGSVNERGDGIQLIGEIEEFGVGKSETKTFVLTPGKHILFCNVVEDSPTADMQNIKAHYKLGMFAAFTVT